MIRVQITFVVTSIHSYTAAWCCHGRDSRLCGANVTIGPWAIHTNAPSSVRMSLSQKSLLPRREEARIRMRRKETMPWPFGSQRCGAVSRRVTRIHDRLRACRIVDGRSREVEAYLKHASRCFSPTDPLVTISKSRLGSPDPDKSGLARGLGSLP